MRRKSLRVCVVSPLYHPSLGGLGKQAQLLSERLAENGVDIFVIARRMKGMPPAAFSRKIRVYRAWSIKPYLHNFEKVEPINVMISLFFSISCARLLFKKRKQYDIVHFHGASLPLLLNIPVLKLLNKRVIAKVAGAKLGIEAGALNGRYYGLGSLAVRLLKMVDAFVATTEEIEEGLLEDGVSAEKINRVPNFIDTDRFTRSSADFKEGMKANKGYKDSRVVTFSGRFIYLKGIIFLLEGWRDVAKLLPDARLLLLGDGPLLYDMKEAARRLGIADSVEFLGHVPHVNDFLSMTDVFVLPSLQEGMPNSLLEAMACGLPVVATRIGGVVDVVRDEENGILVEPRDPKGLAKGVVRLLKNDALAARISLRAYQTIRECYNLDDIIHKYHELYKKILDWKQE